MRVDRRRRRWRGWRRWRAGVRSSVDADVVGVRAGDTPVLDEVAEGETSAGGCAEAGDGRGVLRPREGVAARRVGRVDVEQQPGKGADGCRRAPDVRARAAAAEAHLNPIGEEVR